MNLYFEETLPILYKQRGVKMGLFEMHLIFVQGERYANQELHEFENRDDQRDQYLSIVEKTEKDSRNFPPKNRRRKIIL